MRYAIFVPNRISTTCLTNRIVRRTHKKWNHKTILRIRKMKSQNSKSDVIFVCLNWCQMCVLRHSQKLSNQSNRNKVFPSIRLSLCLLNWITGNRWVICTEWRRNKYWMKLVNWWKIQWVKCVALPNLIKVLEFREKKKKSSLFWYITEIVFGIHEIHLLC